MSRKHKRHKLNSYWSPYQCSEENRPKTAAQRRKERRDDRTNQVLSELVIRHMMEVLRREMR